MGPTRAAMGVGGLVGSEGLLGALFDAPVALFPKAHRFLQERARSELSGGDHGHEPHPWPVLRGNEKLVPADLAEACQYGGMAIGEVGEENFFL